MPMRTVAFFLAFALPCFGAIFDLFSSLSPRAQEAQDLLEGFDQLVERALQEYNVPGVAIGIVVDGHLVYAKGFGLRNREQKLPVTTDTLFAIGSCTKAFTSFVMGTLVDEGLMQWDEPVIDILPEFRLWDQYATQNVTLRDLLAHRSGMPRHDFMWYNTSMPRGEVLKRLRHLEPSCDIRERYQYNNLMYLIAGYAMEQVARQSWETLVTERILHPLQMTHTIFSVDEMQQQPDFATPYLEKEGELKKMSFRNLCVVGPAGSINSSISDLVHWVEMQLGGGVFQKTPLITPTALQEMHAPQVVIGGAPEVKETSLATYGLGWNISSYRGHDFVSHDGGIDGFASVVGLLPKEGVGLVVLCNKNLSTLPRYLSFQLIDRILKLFPEKDWLAEGKKGIEKTRAALEESKQQEALARKIGTVPSHPLEEYEGVYLHPGYGKISVEVKEGRLAATFNGITSFLEHWHYDVFSIAEESQDLIVSRQGMKFTFRNMLYGEIGELIIPFEASASDIVFKKQMPASLFDMDYLRRFAGFYKIYGYTVEIAVRPQGLCALIPGQPLHELVPVSENEFSVKSLMGYSVRFIMDEQGTVEEVVLLQPYGALTATPHHRA